MALNAAPAPVSAYFIRHWRGDFGLGYSFWINTCLIGAALFIAAAGLVAGAGLLETPPPVSSGRRSAQISASLGLHLSVVGYIALLIWQSVGTWRAAQAHAARTGRRLWARTAQGVTAMVAAGSAFALMG